MIKETRISKFDTKYYIENIGFVITRKLYEHLDIIDVYIEEKYRRKGNATKLMAYIIKNNPEMKIMLEVKEDNYPAIKLYEKLRFKKISERKNYYKDKTALIMEYIK